MDKHIRANCPPVAWERSGPEPEPAGNAVAAEDRRSWRKYTPTLANASAIAPLELQLCLD